MFVGGGFILSLAKRITSHFPLLCGAFWKSVRFFFFYLKGTGVARRVLWVL
jgi:hypothetical protein